MKRSKLGWIVALSAVGALLPWAAPQVVFGDDEPQAIAEDHATPEANPVEPAPTATATDEATIRAGAEEIRRALGGSVVNDFPTLQPEAGPTPAQPAPAAGWLPTPSGAYSAEPNPAQVSPWAPQVGGPYRPANIPQRFSVGRAPLPLQRIVALRGAASQMDSTANQLEGLELYDQADAVRVLAQKLRLEARGLATAAENPSGAPLPVIGVEGTPTAPSSRQTTGARLLHRRAANGPSTTAHSSGSMSSPASWNSGVGAISADIGPY